MLKRVLFVGISVLLLLFIVQELHAQMFGGAGTSGIGAVAQDNNQGALLSSVNTSGRASRFGLQQGDIVLSINGQTVKDAQSFINVMNSVARGSAVTARVIRNGVETTVGRTSMGGRGMGGGRGGRRNQNRELLTTYDKNGDGWLDNDERKAARGLSSAYEGIDPVKYGIALTPEDVNMYSDKESLYDIDTLRTIFLEFENPDWETELEFFYHTDVEVPVKMIVDGKVYENVGVRFRGNTSYSRVNTGWKRPLNITMDFLDEDQRLYGYRTLNLLNSISDPTFVRVVLFQKIASEYIPALKANYVRLVINGEHWGIYINYQQFNTDFIKDEFDTRKGQRWKAPQGGGNVGLSYLGDNIDFYRNAYEIKSKDDPNSWAALANLCKVLNRTPIDELEEALKPILDINDTLKFLALDKVSSNADGYWERASDYLIYRDKDERFHFFSYDVLETLGASDGFGRGGRGGRSGGSTNLSPFTGSGSLYRLLSVPNLRQLYLGYIRDIAENWLDWDKILPMARQYQVLIAADMQADKRNPNGSAAFYSDLSIGVTGMSLKSFITQRHQYLLGLEQVQEAPLPKDAKRFSF